MDKLKLDIQMFSTSGDEEEKIYGYDDNGCKYQVYTKNDFCIIESDKTPTSEMKSIALPYPDGFNKYNSYIISVKRYWYKKDGSIKKIQTSYGYLETSGFTVDWYDYYDTQIETLLSDQNIVSGEKDKIVVVLMKIE